MTERPEDIAEERINNLHHEVRDLFPLQILGEPTSKSQFGIRYVTLANGIEKPEGASMPLVDNIRFAFTATRRWFEERKRLGDDVLVWRSLPRIEGEDLWMRCHTMPRHVLVEHLAAGKP